MEYIVEPSYVINKDLFKFIEAVAVCPICLGIAKNAKQCKTCENCFCSICIEEWSKKSNTCPYKCANHELKTPSRTIKSILDSLLFKCPLGCNTELKVNNYVQHVSVCQVIYTNCPTCNSEVKDCDLDYKEKMFTLFKENQQLKAKVAELESSYINSKNSVQNPVSNIRNGGTVHLKQNRDLKAKEYLNKHYPESPLEFTFVCCGKTFHCVQCHNTEENKHRAKASGFICAHCKNKNTNLYLSFCPSCNKQIKVAEQWTDEEEISHVLSSQVISSNIAGGVYRKKYKTFHEGVDRDSDIGDSHQPYKAEFGKYQSKQKKNPFVKKVER